MPNIALIVNNILSDSGVPITYSTSGTGGTSGTSGTNGSSGTSASSGSSGTSASSGTSGSSGTSASSGTSGSSGTSATSGSSGTSASSGSSGTSGTKGTSGTSATSGSSGTSATSGSSGTAGLSGDRYATTSTTSFTLGNAGTITVGTGLAYTVAQSIIIVNNATNFQECEVISYNASTGALQFAAPTRTVGSGTFTAWTVNLDGASGGNGTAGTSGSSGTTGTNGSSGTSASSGTSGSSGSSGTSGTSGSSGTSGTSGSSGTSATSGSSGTSATSGTSGSSGTSGTNGSSGTSATSGSSGTSGSSATSGTSGANGTSGSSGTSGANGTSGSSGTSGTSGTAGSSGTSVAVSGTTNTVAKFTSATTIGNSNITDTGTLITLGSNSYVNGSLGVGSSTLTGINLRVNKPITGATTAFGIQNEGIVQSDVTANANVYNSVVGTAAASFVLGNLNHYRATQFTIGAGSSITNQYGFVVDASLVGAANNYGFFGNIPAASGRWNLYMGGTANNYLAGSLGIGQTGLTSTNLLIGKNITGAVSAYGVLQTGTIQSDVTTSGYGFYNQLNTQAASFTTNYSHFLAVQNTIGAGSAITTQVAYNVASNLTSATNNYGFRGQIPEGANRWNIYMDGTAFNYLAGDTGVGTVSLGSATKFTIGGSETAVSGIARGELNSTTLVASANNDALVGLDINPTFTNGGFANNLNVAVRSLNHAAKFNKLLIGSLTVPTLNSAVGSASGGTLPAATYFYRIVAFDTEGLLTTASNELSVVTTGSTSSVALSWSLVQGAAGYRVYKSNVSNSYSSYISVNGVNTTTLTDTNQAVTSGTIPTANNSSYGLFDSTRLRTNNITLVNNGIGQVASLTFEKSTDGASINVVEYGSDSTMYEFKMVDNPDGTQDFFHWFVGDWQNPSSGWKPLKFAGFTSQFVGQNSNFWSSFSLPASTPYYTTNPDNLANATIKGDPYTSTTYNLVKDNGAGTGTLNVDVTGFTGTSNTIYWVTIVSSTTFNWGIGSWTSAPIGTNVTITGAFQALNNGIQIKLSASGQVAGDRWAFRAFPVPRMGIGTTTPTAPLQISTTVPAASGTARGVLINTTLVASANSDVLVALDIAPTFTNGAFTGVENWGLRVNGNIKSTFAYSNAFVGNTSLQLSSTGSNNISFQTNSTGVERMRLFGSTGNLLVQNGGTFTDAGFRLDVNGTTRVSGVLTLGSTISNGTYTYTLPSATGTLALTSALSGYLPLSGGTLTGALNGTTATFSSTVSATDYYFNSSSLERAAKRYVSTANVSSAGYTVVCNVTGNALASAVRMTFQGTTGSVVINVTADILVNHSQDILITSQAGIYTLLTLRVISNNDENFSVEATSNSANVCTMNVEVYPLNNETVTFGGSAQTGSTLTHSCVPGVKISATGGSTGNFAALGDGTFGGTLGVTGAATFSSSVTASSLIKSGGTSSQYLMADGSTSTLTNPVTGTGTTNYLPKFTGASTIGNSAVSDDGTTVTYGSGSGLKQIYINGGGYDLILGASGGGIFGFTSTNISLVFSTTAKPLGIGTNAAQPLIFGTDATERMRITSGGNVLINTTSDNGSRFQVSGAATFSSSIRANAASTIYGATQDAIQTIFTLGGQNASAQAKELYFRLTAGGTPQWTLQTAAFGTDADINIYPNGTSGLKIAYGGAATFSSSVTAGSNIYIPNGSYYYAKRSTGGADINVLGIASGSDTLTIKGGTSGATNSINFEDTGGIIATFYNGRFGIGTSNPRIASETVGTDAASSSTATPNGAIMVSNPTASNSQVMTMGVVNGAGNHSWIQSRNSTSANFYALALNPVGGNVLIGTTTDAGYKLDVSAITRIYNGDQGSARLVIQNTGSGGQAVHLVAGNPNVDQTGFSIAYGNTNFLRFSSTGAAKFSSDVELNGASGTRTLTIQNNTSGNAVLALVAAGSDSGSITYNRSTSQLVFGNSGATSAFVIANTGAATFSSSVTATSFFESSDKRLKKEISDNSIIDGIEAVKPKLYIKDGKEELGYYAQDLQEILPSAVIEGEDGFLSLSYSQVLVAKVASLENEIAELKQLIKTLL